MEKAIITREQAEAIELFEERNWERRKILNGHAIDPYSWQEYKGINGMDFDKLVIALYAGYEVEPTKEEKLLSEYNYHDEYIQCGIAIALNILNIDVPGITDRNKPVNPS